MSNISYLTYYKGNNKNPSLQSFPKILALLCFIGIQDAALHPLSAILTIHCSLTYCSCRLPAPKVAAFRKPRVSEAGRSPVRRKRQPQLPTTASSPSTECRQAAMPTGSRPASTSNATTAKPASLSNTYDKHLRLQPPDSSHFEPLSGWRRVRSGFCCACRSRGTLWA